MQTALSLAWVLPVIWLVYTVRAVWAARRQWKKYSPDTKAFYILFAPLLTFALDLFVVSDKVFYAPAKRVLAKHRCWYRRIKSHPIKIPKLSFIA